MMQPGIDFDSPWKEALDELLPEAFALFVPKTAAAIDWTQEIVSLDKELQQVAPDEERAAQTVDKLFQVRWRKGTETWMLIHVEVQNQYDTTFAERMLTYHMGLFLRYRKPLYSLAILGDESKKWRPATFDYAVEDCGIHFYYPTVKLVDFDLVALDANPNPFAAVVLAHRLAQQTRHRPEARATAKVALVRRLYRLGYNRERVRRLYRFIDWLMQLPPGLEEATWQQVEALQEENKMPYITYAERRERILGLRVGIEMVLKVRFGEAGKAVYRDIETIWDVTIVEEVLSRLETASTLDEIRAIYQHPRE